MADDPRLDPGSRDIVGARPMMVDFADPGVRWTCTRCGRRFPVAAAWGIETVRPGGERQVRFIVCGRCAPVFERPPGLMVDLTRLRSHSRAASPVLRDVAERTMEIARSRGEETAGQVAIRAVDVREQALRHAIRPSDLVRLLVDEEVASPL